MTKNIGVIGLGNIGKPIAGNILKAGFPVTVFDIREEAIKELHALGATPAGSARGVAEASDIVFIVVLNDMQTEAVILEKDGVLNGMKESSTIIIISTVSPGLCRRIDRQAEEKNVGVLDAPVSGGTVGAEAGTLTIMVGGSEQLLEKCRPVLEVIGKNIFHLGDVGMGQVAKAANNAMFHYNLFGAMEGLNLAVKAGIKLDRMLELVRLCTGTSWPIEHWNLYADMKRKGPPALDLPYKDLNIAVDIGRENGLDMPLASFCLGLNLYELPDLSD